MKLCIYCRTNEAEEGGTMCSACIERQKKRKEEQEQILLETRRRRRLRDLAMGNGRGRPLQ